MRASSRGSVRASSPASPLTAATARSPSPLGKSLGTTAPLSPSTLGATTLGRGLAQTAQTASTPALPSVVSLKIKDAETEKHRKLAKFGVLKGWYKKMRSWNTRIEGAVVKRFDRMMPGGTVVISDGRLPSYPAEDDLYPACCFGCIRIDKIISNMRVKNTEMRPGLVKPDMVFGFGLTTTAPDVCGSTTLRAYDLEDSWVVGYGPYVIHGDDNPKVWDNVHWDPIRLRPGDRVGLMLFDSEPRELIVFVNRVQVLRMQTDLAEDEPIFLVLDLFGTVTQVTLLDLPPPRVALKPGDGDPWYRDPEDLAYLTQPVPLPFAEDPEVATNYMATLTGGFLQAPGEAPAVAGEAFLDAEDRGDAGEAREDGKGQDGYGYDSIVQPSGATGGFS